MTGRVLLKRKLGRIGFATLRDGSGDLQVLVSRDQVGDALYDLWQHDIDLGDHISVTGEVITTRKGELSVAADSLTLTSKSLATAAGQAQGPDRPRGPDPGPLRRPDHPAGGPRHRLRPGHRGPQRPRLAGRSVASPRSRPRSCS